MTSPISFPTYDQKINLERESESLNRTTTFLPVRPSVNNEETDPPAFITLFF